MSRQRDVALIESLETAMRRLYDADAIPYEWSEIVELIQADPSVFDACFRKAKSYKLPSSAPRSYIVWIACNLARSYQVRDDCYFCGKVMTRDEFLTGKVHLEHFQPRSGGGEHLPGNLTLACKDCNLLKRNLSDTDFDQLLSDPESFRSCHRSMTLKRFQQLKEFAEVCAPRFKGLSWIAARYNTKSQHLRKVWDEVRSAYRNKWGIQ